MLAQSWETDKLAKIQQTLESNIEIQTPTRKRNVSPSNDSTTPAKRPLIGSSSLDQTPTRKRSISPLSDSIPPSKRRKHGSSTILSKPEEESLLTEAKSWESSATVNWSELSRRYGMTKPNSGQSIKEFLKDHNIPAALQNQQQGRSHRRKRKTLPGGIPFPMQRPSTFHKKEIQSGLVDKLSFCQSLVLPTIKHARMLSRLLPLSMQEKYPSLTSVKKP